MKCLAVIPARGGSKRLPRKNILPFLGKPMLQWTCEAARQSGAYDKVLVSTEDAEIAATAQACGTAVLPRPAELATDAATCLDVCLHALDTLEKAGEHFDILSCLYATAPLRTAEDIRASMRLLNDAGTSADGIFAVSEYFFPAHQAQTLSTEGLLHAAHPLLAELKSQQVPEFLVDNGSLYTVHVPAFRHYRTLRCPRILAYRMPRMRSIDIDTREDYEIALCFAQYLQGEHKNAV